MDVPATSSRILTRANIHGFAPPPTRRRLSLASINCVCPNFSKSYIS